MKLIEEESKMNRLLLSAIVLLTSTLLWANPSHGYSWYHASPGWCAGIISDFKTGQFQKYVETLDQAHLSDLSMEIGYCSNFDDTITHFLNKRLETTSHDNWAPIITKMTEGLPTCDDEGIQDALVSAARNSPAGRTEGLELLDVDQIEDITEKVLKAWSGNINKAQVDKLLASGVVNKRDCSAIAITNSGKRGLTYGIEPIKGKIYVTNVSFSPFTF